MKGQQRGGSRIRIKFSIEYGLRHCQPRGGTDGRMSCSCRPTCQFMLALRRQMLGLSRLPTGDGLTEHETARAQDSCDGANVGLEGMGHVDS